jgi:hypothetical protein
MCPRARLRSVVVVSEVNNSNRLRVVFLGCPLHVSSLGEKQMAWEELIITGSGRSHRSFRRPVNGFADPRTGARLADMVFEPCS